MPHKDKKLTESFNKFKQALKYEKKIHDNPVYFAGIVKCFETCLEYAWKFMKREATEQGFEVYSPREAIKLAGKIKLIDDVEKWLNFLEDRNLSVHDYLGISDEDYLKLIKDFNKEMTKLVK